MKKTTSMPVRVVRCLRVGLHILWGISVVAVAYPWIQMPRQLWLKQRWSRQMLEILGIRLEGQVEGLAPGTLIVGNHISWLDIFALNAAHPVAFVTKSDVRSWPVFGWLTASTGNLFIQRGNRQNAIESCKVVARYLDEGRDIAIFPEGTTSDGQQVLEFRGALLQAAIDSGRRVQSVALAYYDAEGQRTTRAAYAGGTTMRESLLAVLSCPSLSIRLSCLPALDSQGWERRELAAAARKAIVNHLGLPEALPDEASKQFLPECLRASGKTAGTSQSVPG